MISCEPLCVFLARICLIRQQGKPIKQPIHNGHCNFASIIIIILEKPSSQSQLGIDLKRDPQLRVEQPRLA